MVRIGWTKRSLRQLRSIRAYIARDSEYQAARVCDLIRKSADNLRRHPELGAVVPEAKDGNVREIGVFSYRIIYRWDETNQMIRILLVMHGAQLLDEKVFRE